jgi:hypothetical protein
MTTSWTGYCHGCARTGVPVQTRYDHGAKTLCDACATATRRVPMTPTVASTPTAAKNRELDISTVAPPPTLAENTSATGTSFLTEEPWSSSLSSSLCKGGREQQELAFTDGLIEDHRNGLIEPLDVTLPPLPESATPTERLVYEDFRYILGLRLAASMARPVPYACRWVAARHGVSYRAVSGALVSLRRLGILDLADDPEFKKRSGPRPTNLYLPRGFEPFAVTVEVADHEPEHESVDEAPCLPHMPR